MKIDAVIMAKSTMLGNFCVAGIDIITGKWVRFVAFETGKPLADFNLMFVNDSGSCEPLDVGRIGIARKVPVRNHTEDCMIKYTAWLKMGRMKLEEVLKIHPPEEHKYIFGTPRDFIDKTEMSRLKLNYSLILIHVEKLKIYFVSNFSGNIRGRADFIYNGIVYKNIRVTDPNYEPDTIIAKKFSVSIPEAYLVMSMPAKDFNGKYYKLIAKIFPKERKKEKENLIPH